MQVGFWEDYEEEGWVFEGWRANPINSVPKALYGIGTISGRRYVTEWKQFQAPGSAGNSGGFSLGAMLSSGGVKAGLALFNGGTGGGTGPARQSIGNIRGEPAMVERIGNNENRNSKVISTTLEAISHYYNGNGESVNLGDDVIDAVLNDSEHQEHINNILSGNTTERKGSWSIDLEFDFFHMGETNAYYDISCEDGNCVATVEIFKNDGFYDPNYLFEGMVFIYNKIHFWMPDQYRPDDVGSRYELFGTPFGYNSAIIKYYYKNPGYPW